MNKRSPFLWALGAGVAVLLAAFVPVLLNLGKPVPVSAPGGGLPAPWQVDLGASGEVRAFGLRLPGSTLADAQALWGDDLQVAVIGRRGEPAALEAYTERWSGGGVTGRLVLATDAPASDVERWQAGAAKREQIDGQAQRWVLRDDDRTQALQRAVTGATLLPAGRLDEATLTARFGAPAQVLAGEGDLRHWLYPARGLAMAWDSGRGKLVLQVVAPAEFQRRLLQPLQAAQLAPASERRP